MKNTGTLRFGAFVGTAIMLTGCAAAGSFPPVGTQHDSNQPWTALPGAGYLAFEPYLDNVFGPITAVPGSIRPDPYDLGTEEDTGWSQPDGVGFSDLGLSHDGHEWAGNKVDFDWVRENRSWEKALVGQHPQHTGLLPFMIRDAPPRSPHESGGRVHDHGALGELILGEFGGLNFNRVDVFSIGVLQVDADTGLDVETDAPGPGESVERAAALDYDLWFVNLQTKTSAHGVPEVVFVPGWNPHTSLDDYVTRWRPSFAGSWNAVAIEPHRGDGRDDTCEIDAVIAALVP